MSAEANQIPLVFHMPPNTPAGWKFLRAESPVTPELEIMRPPA
jgi:hypothetical protein